MIEKKDFIIILCYNWVKVQLLLKKEFKLQESTKNVKEKRKFEQFKHTTSLQSLNNKVENNLKDMKITLENMISSLENALKLRPGFPENNRNIMVTFNLTKEQLTIPGACNLNLQSHMWLFYSCMVAFWFEKNKTFLILRSNCKVKK